MSMHYVSLQWLITTARLHVSLQPAQHAWPDLKSELSPDDPCNINTFPAEFHQHNRLPGPLSALCLESFFICVIINAAALNHTNELKSAV